MGTAFDLSEVLEHAGENLWTDSPRDLAQDNGLSLRSNVSRFLFKSHAQSYRHMSHNESPYLTHAHALVINWWKPYWIEDCDFIGLSRLEKLAIQKTLSVPRFNSAELNQWALPCWFAELQAKNRLTSPSPSLRYPDHQQNNGNEEVPVKHGRYNLSDVKK